jgi:hypothetical protein
MTKPTTVLAFLAVAALTGWGLYHYTRVAPVSAVVLFASYDSGTAGSWLELRADGTYTYTSASVFSQSVTSGSYYLRDSLLSLSRLPKKGVLKRKELLIRSSPKHLPGSTGRSVWQLDKVGHVDSSLAILTVYHTMMTTLSP